MKRRCCRLFRGYVAVCALYLCCMYGSPPDNLLNQPELCRWRGRSTHVAQAHFCLQAGERIIRVHTHRVSVFRRRYIVSLQHVEGEGVPPNAPTFPVNFCISAPHAVVFLSKASQARQSSGWDRRHRLQGRARSLPPDSSLPGHHAGLPEAASGARREAVAWGDEGSLQGGAAHELEGIE